jgi:hypothetical protein
VIFRTLLLLLLAGTVLLLPAQQQQPVSSLSSFFPPVIAIPGIRTAPLSVFAFDASGAAVAGAPVVWSAKRPGVTFDGGASQLTTLTDSRGRASVSPTEIVPPTGAVSYETVEIEASSGSARPLTFRILSLAAPPVITVLKPDPPVIDAIRSENWNQAYVVSIQAASGTEAGKGIPGIYLRMTATEPVRSPDGGFVADLPQEPGRPTPICNIPSNANGEAGCNIAAGFTAGTTRLYCIVGESIVMPPLTVNVTAGPAPRLEIVSGSGQVGRPGERLPIALRVRPVDGTGAPMSNLQVSWGVVSGIVFVSDSVTRTDADGFTSTIATLGDRPGAIRLRAATERGAFADFSLAVAGLIGGLEIVQGNGQAAAPGQAFALPLIVRAYDANRNAAAGIPVRFTINSLGTLSSNLVNTDQDGLARVSVTAGSTRGAILVTATADVFSVPFTLGVVAPAFTIDKLENAVTSDEGLTPCGIARLTGKGFAPGLEGVLTALGTPSTSLGPVQGITIAGLRALILSVRNFDGGGESIDFQTPCGVSPGQISGSLVVATFASSGSVGFGSLVKPAQPGIFENAAQHLDGTTITTAHRAVPGEIIRILATGLGKPDASEAPDKPLTLELIAGVNDEGVPISRAIYSSESLRYFVDIEIPKELKPSSEGFFSAVLAVRLEPGADFLYSNTVRIPVR